MKVIYARAAVSELDEIWMWNLEHHGLTQAQAYITFIQDQIESLSDHPFIGPALSTRSDLRYLVMKWNSAGHGHVAVYTIDQDDENIIIAHVFHTRQNWQKKALRRTKTQ